MPHNPHTPTHLHTQYDPHLIALMWGLDKGSPARRVALLLILLALFFAVAAFFHRPTHTLPAQLCTAGPSRAPLSHLQLARAEPPSGVANRHVDIG